MLWAQWRRHAVLGSRLQTLCAMFLFWLGTVRAGKVSFRGVVRSDDASEITLFAVRGET